MIRYLLLLLLIHPFATSAQGITASSQVYYGELKYPDHLYRVFVTIGDLDKVGFYILGFRPNQVPVKNIMVTSDSIAFERDDFFSAFRGKWSLDKRSIKGTWFGEKKKKFPLHLTLALADTISGVFPRIERTYTYSIPASKEGGIRPTHISSSGINEKLLTKLGQEILDQRYGYLHSLLIARNNNLVVEEYFYNLHSKVSWGIQSVTKSFVSALTGIAIQRSEMTGTNMTLCESLPAYREVACNEENRNITIGDLLSMSTGLEWDEISSDYGEPTNSLSKATNSGDPFRFLLTRQKADKQFAYNSMNHLLMNKVLRTATCLSNKTEMKQRLMEPLGIVDYDLGERDHGILGDISLTPRDMLKFGLVYLNEGSFNGKEVVPSAWVRESTSTKVTVDHELGYGYFWWTTTFQWKNRSVESFFAWGYGGQYIIVVPELKLVVVMTGSNWSTYPKRHMMEIMRDYIIPACE